MKTVAAQRVVPLRVSKRARPSKKSRLDSALATRRQAALKSRWDVEKERGRKLKLVRVGQLKGSIDGSMAWQCLHGHRALNVEWMLHFARELGLPPQEIWGTDWPFPDLTPAVSSPALELLIRRWDKLSDAAKGAIVNIMEHDKRR
jgi:hypothetical protein